MVSDGGGCCAWYWSGQGSCVILPDTQIICFFLFKHSISLHPYKSSISLSFSGLGPASSAKYTVQHVCSFQLTSLFSSSHLQRSWNNILSSPVHRGKVAISCCVITHYCELIKLSQGGKIGPAVRSKAVLCLCPPPQFLKLFPVFSMSGTTGLFVCLVHSVKSPGEVGTVLQDHV